MFGEVIGELTGSVTANYSSSTDKNGDITYGFDGSSASLSVNAGVPIEMYISANVPTGGTQDWSDVNTWDGGGLLALQDAATLSSTVAGVDEGDWFSYISLPSDAFNTLINTGPTEKSIGIPGLSLNCSILPSVDVQLSASESLLYDVVLPTGSTVLMDQPSVVVQSLTIQPGATLSGNGNFTVRTDLLNEGTLYGVGGTSQGNFSNTSVGQQPAFADITALTSIQGTLVNSGTLDVEPTATVHLSQAVTNYSSINLGGTFYMHSGSSLNNEGTYTMSGGASFVSAFDGPSYPVVVNNSGTFQEVGAGTAIIGSNGGIVLNNSGTIGVNGGTLQLNNAGSPHSSSNGSFDFSNGGQLVLVNGAVMTLSGTNTGSGNGQFAVNGTIQAPGGQTTSLNFGSGNLVFNASAEIGSGLVNAGDLQIAGGFNPVNLLSGAMLTNNGTIEHTQGGLEFHSGSSLNNQSTYTMSGGASFVSAFDGPSYPVVVNNSGTFQKVGIGVATIGPNGGIVVDNSGMIESEEGTLDFNSGFTQMTGTTVMEGGNLSGTLNFQGGLLKGSGTITGSVTNNGATVSPGNSPGAITITGDYHQSSTGILSIELAGGFPGQYDLLNVQGTAYLDGTLDISLLNGFEPSLGETFQILDFSKLNGTFTSVDVLNDPGDQFALTYNGSDLMLSTTGVPEPEALAARGESPARRRAGDFGRDRGVEMMQYLDNTSESRQRRARPKDPSDGRATFATGC